MKNNEKIESENGNGKGRKSSKNPENYFPKWDAGGSRGMLASCTAPSPALNPQIIAHPFKGKGACGKQKEGKVRRRCVMRGCMKGKCPEKDAEKTEVRGDKGASTLNPTLPFGRKRPGGEFWTPFSLIFGAFGCHFGLFSLLVRRFRRFPNTYPLILIRRFPPRGAAVCALRTQ